MIVAVFDDTKCSLGEGPLWHPLRQTLFWFDIDQKVMFEKAIGGERTAYRFDRTVSAAGWVDATSLIIASERDLFRFELESRIEEPLCELEADRLETRSNDGRADPFGGFWIGTMGYRPNETMGAIYRYFKGELRKLFADIRIPNSICFSIDGSRAFFTDSDVGTIWQVDLDRHGWPIAESRAVFVDLQNEAFAPDGAVCDRDGRLWSAQWDASQVATYSDSGELIQTFQFPVTQTTCPAFGGPDLKTLFVTSAGDHLPPELSPNQPLAGCTLMVENAGQGQVEHQVKLG